MIDIFLVLLMLFCVVMLSVQTRWGIKHREKARNEGREVRSLWYHINTACKEQGAKTKTTKANKSDQIAQETAVLHGFGQKKANPYIKPRKVSGRKLDTVQFTYMDSGGNYTEREVVVQLVTDDCFEGYCKLRRETRTFRIDRVVGSVVSKETGEIIDPFVWSLRF